MAASGGEPLLQPSNAGAASAAGRSESGMSMEWSDLSFTIKGKQILQNVAGRVSPGEMACILGPSGAGKSTLLNLLAGRMNTKKMGLRFSAKISLNGAAVDPVKVRSNIAYVMQEDALPSLSTPRECLQMSAILRLAGRRNDVLADVNDIIDRLLLGKCADTYVGSDLIKGISGGERKRTSVGTELITKPSLVFLDEPLSGLDSYAAWTVVQVLRGLAESGCAVLCTVHQPSSEIFQCFSKMICLAEGKTCYCGPVGDLLSHMAKIGSPVPDNYNPADHILFHAQTRSQEELAAFTSTWAEMEKASVLPELEAIRGKAAAGEIPAPNLQRASQSGSILTQWEQLLLREYRQVTRNKFRLVMRFGVSGVMGAIFACIFQGVGGKNDTMRGLQSHFGAVCNIMIGSFFGASQPLLLEFTHERPIFLREYAADMYGVAPYFLAKMVMELPVTLVAATEALIISYLLMGLKGNFLYLLIISFGLQLTAASTAIMISCSVTNPKSATELFSLFFGPQLLFSGLYVAINLIPWWLRWLQYVFPLKYAINLACLVEFNEVEGGDEFLGHLDIYRDRQWFYFGILAALLCVLRILSMLALRQGAKFVY